MAPRHDLLMEANEIVSNGCLSCKNRDAVNKDEFVTIDLTKTNRHADLFGRDAEVFNPHRTPDDNLPLHGLSFGGGAHVCNCGFVTSPAARGKGVARLMLDHALQSARDAGFYAMQFNFVVASNVRAIDIWTRAGFDTVGRLPNSFRHPKDGLVDALVMYRRL